MSDDSTIDAVTHNAIFLSEVGSRINHLEPRMNKGNSTESGIIFGPTPSGKSYISLFYHRPSGGRPHKHLWHDNVPPIDEFSIFGNADVAEWRDATGHYWAVAEGGERILGLRGEKLAHFPKNNNSNNPWHGYPVSPLERGDSDSPPDEFVHAWIMSGVISKTIGRRIQRRKI